MRRNTAIAYYALRVLMPEAVLDTMKAAAAQRGGVLLSDAYTKKTAKYHWRCREGHEWRATASNVLNNKSWCPICGNIQQGRSKALSIEDMKEVAIKRGGECLSTEYRNHKTKLRWRCAKGHEWMTEAGPVRDGNWCPTCSGRLGNEGHLKRLRDAATAKGGMLISTNYLGPRTKHRFRCAKGHEWNAVPYSVLKGTWCGVCAGVRLSDDPTESKGLYLRELRTIAEARGGKLLSETYENSNTDLRWQCSDGHVWEQVGYHIRNGVWCPYCKTGFSERYVRQVFEHLTGAPFPKKRPPWLQTKEWRKLELDGYSEPLQVAFEYQGEQHFKEVAHFRDGQICLDLRQRIDEHKRAACRASGVLLIEISYLDDKETLPRAIAKQIEGATGTSAIPSYLYDTEHG